MLLIFPCILTVITAFELGQISSRQKITIEKSIFNANYDGNFFESFSTMEQNKGNYEMKSLSYYKVFNLSLALLFKGKHIDPSYHSISKAHSTEADSSYRRSTDDSIANEIEHFITKVCRCRYCFRER